MTDDHNDPITATRATAGLIERIARAWAGIDGKVDLFDACKAAPKREQTEGYYGGYMAEAEELAKRAGLLDPITATLSTAGQFGHPADGGIVAADHSGDANKKVAELIERMERIVRNKYAHRDVLIHNCDLGQITFGDVRDLCDTVRAIPAAQPTPRVKPLEWVKHPTSELWFCDTAVGNYTVIGNRAKPSWNFDGANENTSQMAENVPSAITMAVADYQRRVSALLAPAVQDGAHPDDLAVDRFAAAMKAKLARKRVEGRGGWDGPDCDADTLSRMLREHVEKSDPVDVGNLAMMLHQRSERILPAAQDGEDVGALKAEVERLIISDDVSRASIATLKQTYNRLLDAMQAEQDDRRKVESERNALKAEVERLRKALGDEQDSADDMADVLSACGDGLMFDMDRLQEALDQHDALRAEQKGDA